MDDGYYYYQRGYRLLQPTTKGLTVHVSTAVGLLNSHPINQVARRRLSASPVQHPTTED